MAATLVPPEITPGAQVLLSFLWAVPHGNHDAKEDLPDPARAHCASAGAKFYPVSLIQVCLLQNGLFFENLLGHSAC